MRTLAAIAALLSAACASANRNPVLESTGRVSCSIRDVRVFVNAQITLPRWTPPADTEPGLVTEWARFLTALETHEAGHKDISARAGKAIIDRLRGLSAPCAMLGTSANDLARDIVNRASQEQSAYDATTRHGQTQGTGFGARRRSVADSSERPVTDLIHRPCVSTPIRGVQCIIITRHVVSLQRPSKGASRPHVVSDALRESG